MGLVIAWYGGLAMASSIFMYIVDFFAANACDNDESDNATSMNHPRDWQMEYDRAWNDEASFISNNISSSIFAKICSLDAEGMPTPGLVIEFLGDMALLMLPNAAFIALVGLQHAAVDVIIIVWAAIPCAYRDRIHTVWSYLLFLLLLPTLSWR